MTKWEYEIADCKGLNFGNLGQMGWELVSVDGGIAYFKRLIIFDSEREPWTTTFERLINENKKLTTLAVE